jgi:adenylate cyclase
MTGRALDPGHSGLSAQTIINIRSRDCWLLVADIKNSTAMAARLSSTDLAIAVGRWMGTCKEFIDARGGAINKFLGDGFFAYWVAGNTPPETIVDAVAALRTLQRDAGGPRFRIVLHYGQVAFGGGGSLGEDSLSGVDVVVAFRMERLAGTLGTDVLVSEEVRRRLSEWMSFHDAGEHPVPGLDGVSRRFYSAS